jgi:hypothetical protein
MTPVNRHRIQRQVIELDIGTSANGPAMQETIARSFRERTLPEIERLFDRVAGPEQLVRIDRLALDLGEITGGDWEREFRSRLIEELSSRLVQIAPTRTAKALPGQLQAHADFAEPMAQLTWFLVHGRLPWWSARPRDGWVAACIATLDPAGRAELRQLLIAEASARVRLIQCVDDTGLARVVMQWAQLPAVDVVIAWLAPAQLAYVARQQWRIECWQLIFEWILRDTVRVGRDPTLLRQLIELTRSFSAMSVDSGRERAGQSSARTIAAIEEAIALPAPWQDWRAEIVAVRALEARANEAPDAKGDEDVSHLLGARDSQGKNEGASPLNRGGATNHRPQTADAQRSNRHATTEPEPVFITGAGAVLLHPFVKELFHERDLIEGRDFRDRAARAHAIHLIGVLTFGRPETAEYDLVLAKLLCGWPIDEPLPSTEIIEADLAACDGLLRAVLKHWTALRSSSPDWLRAQFLLRDGKLEAVDLGWRLTVERRGQDVLLAKLPWGCGVIALPWMNGRLFVQWID